MKEKKFDFLFWRHCKPVGLSKYKLPPLYHLFLSKFETGKNSIKHERLLYKDEFIQFSCVNYFGDNGYENTITYFFDEIAIEAELARYNNQVDDYHKDGFIAIGYFDVNDTILLGLKETNLDEIWKLNGDWGDERNYNEKLATNVFDLLQHCSKTVIHFNLSSRNIAIDDLYQKFGEDFWRIRE